MSLRATLNGDGHAELLRLDLLRLDLLRLDLLRLDLLRLDLLLFRRQKERLFPLAQLQLESFLHITERFFLHGDPVNLRRR